MRSPIVGGGAIFDSASVEQKPDLSWTLPNRGERTAKVEMFYSPVSDAHTEAASLPAIASGSAKSSAAATLGYDATSCDH